MDLVEFLRARLDEDEKAARAVVEARPGEAIPKAFRPWDLLSGGDLDPAVRRLLREVEAKRRIIDMASGSADFHAAMPIPGYAQPFHSPSVDVLTRTYQLLALPYSDHPDYDPRWSPGDTPTDAG